MASGFGITGNASRCYNFWKNWSYCVAEHGYARKCVPFRDDYIECLHHGKEVWPPILAHQWKYTHSAQIQREVALFQEWKFQEARKKEEAAGGHEHGGHH